MRGAPRRAALGGPRAYKKINKRALNYPAALLAAAAAAAAAALLPAAAAAAAAAAARHPSQLASAARY